LVDWHFVGRSVDILHSVWTLAFIFEIPYTRCTTWVWYCQLLGKNSAAEKKNRPLLNLTFWRHLGWWKFCYFRLRAWEKYILGNSAPLRPFLYKIGLNSAAVLSGRSTFYSALFWVILCGRTIGLLATHCIEFIIPALNGHNHSGFTSNRINFDTDFFSPTLNRSVLTVLFGPLRFRSACHFPIQVLENEEQFNQRPPNGPVLLPQCSTVCVCSWHQTSPQNGHL
jgi:hypothetical protein